MKMTRTTALVLAAAVPALVPVSLNAQELDEASSRGEKAEREGSLDENVIVVTGELIRRSLLATAGSVEVLDVAEIRRNGDAPLNEALRNMPNLLVESISEAPVVRGVQGGGAGGLATGVTAGPLPRLPIIVDGVVQVAALPYAGASGLWDVEQVEVFLGPQTVLRGRNALAGTIVIETADPTFTFESAARAAILFDEVGQDDHQLSAMVSGPLAGDVLAGRLTVDYRAGGDPRVVTDVPAGQDADFQTDFDSLRLRGKLLLETSISAGALRIEALGDYQSGRTPQTRNAVAGPDFEERTIAFNGPQRIFDGDTASFALDASLATGNWTIRSVSAYTRDHYASIEEQVFPSDFDVEEEIFTQDLTAAFGNEKSRFSGLLGATYERRTQDVNVAGVPLNTQSNAKTDTAAIFADLRVRPAKRLTLVAGGRLQTVDFRRNQTTLTLLPTPGGIVRIPGADQFTDDDTVFLPNLGLIFEPAEDQSLRVMARRGYGQGGGAINFLSGQSYTFDPETVWQYEIGYRAAFLDGAVRLGATAFYGDFDNPQFFVQRRAGDPSSVDVVNQPEGESYGAEFTLAADITPRFTLDGSLGLLKTEITQASASNPGFAGNRFSRDPDMTASGGFVWQPVDGITLDGRATFVGEYFSELDNLNEVGDYVLVDAGVSAGIGPFEARVFVRNLFDEFAVTRRFGDFADVVPPRTVGLSLTARYR